MVLKTVATYGLGKTKTGTTGVFLNVARGSVLDFAPPKKKTKILSSSQSSSPVGAIVNAANEGCLGGGGVDGAINDAGGRNLWKDREALPLLLSKETETPGSRCNTGGAVVTGPGDYGSLRVRYVIHAVGPAYLRFSKDEYDDNEEDDDDDDECEFDEPDALLRSAYRESLERCRDEGITDVAFSLLSAGVFRGNRSLREVLTIGVMAIRDWVAEEEQLKGAAAKSDGDGEEDGESVDGDVDKVASSSSPHRLKSVTLCGFSKNEVNTLTKVCQAVFTDNDERKEEEEEDDNDNDNDDIVSTNTKIPLSTSDE